MKKIVYILTVDEKNEIENLFEQKMALENLSKIIDIENDKLYNKLILDYGRTIKLYNDWWNKMSKKYQWEGQNWLVDFDTNEVIIQEV